MQIKRRGLRVIGVHLLRVAVRTASATMSNSLLGFVIAPRPTLMHDGTVNSDGASADTVLVEQARRGDPQAVGRLLDLYRPRLRLMVDLRLDRRLQGRLDPSDVLQEAYLDACKRIGEYAQKASMPFFVWLRLLTAEKLVFLHRHHLRVQMRDAGREVQLPVDVLCPASSAVLAAELVARHPSPSDVAAQAEMGAKLEAALDAMDALDREVLVLRHFEQLTNCETAHTLGLTESAASQRYVRALERLRAMLSPG